MRLRNNYRTKVMCTEPVLNQMKILNKREYPMSKISIEKILSVVIPLPDIDTQKRLSKQMMKQMRKVQKAQEELSSKQMSFVKEVFGE